MWEGVGAVQGPPDRFSAPARCTVLPCSSMRHFRGPGCLSGSRGPWAFSALWNEAGRWEGELCAAGAPLLCCPAGLPSPPSAPSSPFSTATPSPAPTACPWKRERGSLDSGKESEGVGRPGEMEEIRKE